MAAEDENPPEQEPSGEISWRQALATVGLALAIPGMIGVPTYLGWWVDRRYDTWPVMFTIGLVTGLLGAAIDIYKLMKRFGQFK
jgi:hypothetical protein